MPGPGDATAGPYRVVYPEVVRHGLLRASERAAELGLQPDFLAAAKAVEARLQSDPLEFGEPLYTLRHAGLEVRAGAFNLLGVRYGVDRARRLVYVVEFKLLRYGS
jgi:hypothetical protein